MVMLYIKLNGITKAATWFANILPEGTPHPGGRVKRSKITFFMMLHIKLKGMTHVATMVASILPADAR